MIFSDLNLLNMRHLWHTREEIWKRSGAWALMNWDSLAYEWLLKPRDWDYWWKAAEAARETDTNCSEISWSLRTALHLLAYVSSFPLPLFSWSNFSFAFFVPPKNITIFFSCFQQVSITLFFTHFYDVIPTSLQSILNLLFKMLEMLFSNARLGVASASLNCLFVSLYS